MQNWKDRYEAKLTKPWMKKYFSYRGRLNRKPYILRSLVLALVLNIILPLGLGMLTFALPSGEIVFNIFSAVLGLVYSVASFSLVARRLQDIDNGAESFITLNLGVGIGIFVIGLICLLLSFLPIPFIRTLMGGIITFVFGCRLHLQPLHFLCQHLPPFPKRHNRPESFRRRPASACGSHA